jgi:hypothetical protein
MAKRNNVALRTRHEQLPHLPEIVHARDGGVFDTCLRL